MAMARAVKRGEEHTDSETVRKVASSMTDDQLTDFMHAETPDQRRNRKLASIARQRARGKK